MTTITLVESVLHSVAGQCLAEHLVAGIECRSTESVTTTLNRKWQVILS
jgi:hypothetical protein